MKIAFSVLFLLPLLLHAQNDHNSYTQELTGTDLKFDMIAIPGAEFKMGSPKNEVGRQNDEGPQHQVKISSFWMAKFEVTWDLFEPFVYKNFEMSKSKDPLSPEVDAVTRPTKPYLDMTFGMGKEGFPAVGMTQYAAIQFCKWLYNRTGVFYRLPTEAEWEYACRASTNTPYSFDDESKAGEYAWYNSNSLKKTHPAGSKKPNPWGLYDMHGNVAEWTFDQYKPDFYNQFKNTTAVDPVAIPESLYPHVIRGGSYEDNLTDLRSASRKGSDPEWKRIDPQLPKSNWWFPEAPFVGFRVVRPLNPPSKQEIEAYYNREPIEDF
ncbi:MAG: formylglycine-generating enzyme family protein [Sphingobacteriaceae bacterium]